MPSLPEQDNVIFHEMMTHPALFTHPCPREVVIIDENTSGIHEQTLKHAGVHVTHYHANQGDQWIRDIAPGSLDILIIASPHNSILLPEYFNLLNTHGILVQQAESLFHTDSIKLLHQHLITAKFRDVHTLHFPQPNFPSGWRTALMAIKQSGFKRPREKDIFNKSFRTHYYNLDTHKAALALPEFLKEVMVS